MQKWLFPDLNACHVLKKSNIALGTITNSVTSSHNDI